MFNRICIELKPAWATVDLGAHHHQVCEYHRWHMSNASREHVERLAFLLRSVGTITEKLDAYPTSIEIVTLSPTAQAVAQIEAALNKVFGE